MKSNRVTLFSNGMGHFTRHYEVKSNDPKRISLPFNKNHISDVATSLNTFRSEGGTVRYSVPPSFTPTNAHASSLQIDATNALCSLLEKLSGADALISFVNSSKPDEKFRIIGIDSLDSVGINGEIIKHDAVSVLSENNLISRYRLSEINGIRFTNEAVQAEVDKALRANFQQIKPESTFIDLVLEADEDSVAAVTYTIPVAAWKMRYSIQQEGDKFFLEGAVVVDNNTDEDWNDFMVSVVTGDPISFMTDIAEIKTPQRRMVNLVNTDSVSNVNVEHGYALETCASPMMAGGRAKSMSTRSVANVASFGMDETPLGAMPYGTADMVVSDGVDTKEIGDFCVFTSKTPISIASKKSAVVPMFNIGLKTAGVILLYKESNHARRPFRAVKFKNEADYTLGKGKVVLYHDGLLAGECVLETAKPGDNRMLPHCLENGVRIIKENVKNNRVLTSIRLSDSLAIQEWVSLANANFVIENNKNEAFKVALEVETMLGMESSFTHSGVVVSEVEKLQAGYRLYFTLDANQKLNLVINEKLITEQRTQIGNNFQWIRNNIVSTGNELSNNEGVKKCIAIQKEIDEIIQRMNKSQERASQLDSQANRIRLNIEKAGTASITDWISDLDKFEKECRNIEDVVVPEIQAQKQAKEEQLRETLSTLSGSWNSVEAQEVK